MATRIFTAPSGAGAETLSWSRSRESSLSIDAHASARKSLTSGPPATAGPAIRSHCAIAAGEKSGCKPRDSMTSRAMRCSVALPLPCTGDMDFLLRRIASRRTCSPRSAARPMASTPGARRGSMSAQVCAAVHVPVLSRDVARVRPGEEAHDRGDFLGRAAAPDDRLVQVRGLRAARGAALGVDEARNDAVHRDVVLREVVREAAREADEAQLGRDDVGAA